MEILRRCDQMIRQGSKLYSPRGCKNLFWVCKEMPNNVGKTFQVVLEGLCMWENYLWLEHVHVYFLSNLKVIIPFIHRYPHCLFSWCMWIFVPLKEALKEVAKKKIVTHRNRNIAECEWFWMLRCDPGSPQGTGPVPAGAPVRALMSAGKAQERLEETCSWQNTF